jgi:hypothetical protein
MKQNIARSCVLVAVLGLTGCTGSPASPPAGGATKELTSAEASQSAATSAPPTPHFDDAARMNPPQPNDVLMQEITGVGARRLQLHRVPKGSKSLTFMTQCAAGSYSFRSNGKALFHGPCATEGWVGGGIRLKELKLRTLSWQVDRDTAWKIWVWSSKKVD